MAQTLRARGQDVTVALWGPKNDTWHLFDVPESGGSGDPARGGAVTGAVRTPAAGAVPPSKLAERMSDRRHQVLMAGLGKAGLYDLAPEDDAAVQALVDGLDEATVRRVAHWLGVSAGH
ncbi:hypothetical protein [Streptomyces sp. NPDC046197]|uniref:hypothetical protein n=1 Tax=Streptomyces sp. NPDC046197 TaxID=3154337 RepID=UPI0033F1F7FF